MPVGQFASSDMHARPTRTAVGIAVAAVVALAAPAGRAADPIPAAWATGAEAAARLAQGIGVAWSDVQLRPALARLAETQRFALLVDRRLDPGRRVALTIEDTTLAEALRRIAAELGVGLSVWDELAYFGPADTAHRLLTVAALRTDEAQRLSIDARRRWLKRAPLVWPDFAQPRELVAVLANEVGARVTGIERVPHDLWAAADLPPLTAVERLTLLLAQFDLTFRLHDDGQTLTIEPLPQTVAIERRYSGGSRPEQTAERYRELLPHCLVSVAGSKVVVQGLEEDHRRIAAGRSAPRASAPAAGATTIYTLTVKNVPLGRLMDELRKKQPVPIEVDAAALAARGLTLETAVSVDVENATLDALLVNAVAPLGLTARRQDKGLLITAAAEP